MATFGFKNDETFETDAMSGRVTRGNNVDI